MAVIYMKSLSIWKTARSKGWTAPVPMPNRENIASTWSPYCWPLKTKNWMKRLMLERRIHQDVIDTIALCGIDLDHWLEGFHDTEDSVRNTINTISHHPLVPRDVNLHGYIIDSVTGKLTEVK